MKISPLSLGPAGRLVAVRDEPDAARKRRTCVVLCQPIGHEYVRCHRGVRQLATRLAQEGFEVLRFDYSGCGDSPGEGHEFGLSTWVDDVGHALEAARQRFASIALVGLRMGANLALQAFARRRDVDALVLWEPVTDGGRYLDELGAAHDAHVAEYGTRTGGAPAGAREFLGFAFGEALLEQLRGIDLARAGRAGERAVPTLVVANDEGFDADAVRAVLPEGSAPETLVAAERRFWNADPYEMVVPQETIAGIADWLGRSAP